MFQQITIGFKTRYHTHKFWVWLTWLTWIAIYWINIQDISSASKHWTNIQDPDLKKWWKKDQYSRYFMAQILLHPIFYHMKCKVNLIDTCDSHLGTLTLFAKKKKKWRKKRIYVKKCVLSASIWFLWVSHLAINKHIYLTYVIRFLDKHIYLTHQLPLYY